MEAGAGPNDHVTFGFAFLDAAAGHFYLGSLSDGAGRANLTTLLTQAGPSTNPFWRHASTQGCCVRVCAVRMPAMSAGKVQRILRPQMPHWNIYLCCKPCSTATFQAVT